MSVTLRKRKNADGTTSLRLDIYTNGKHKIETLKHLQLAKVSNATDRESNKELLQKAEAIRLVRTVELEGSNYNMDSEAGKKTIITEWMQSYIDTYTKKDKRNMQGACKRFSAFLTQKQMVGLTFGHLTPLLIEDFIDYLQSRSKGEGASSYYNRFKKMIKQAYKRKLLKQNILDNVEGTTRGRAKKKDTLTLDEIQLLATTPTESSEVRRAALYSTVTGLAWIDIKALKWKNIRLEYQQMELIREKGKDDNNTVTIPLNKTALGLLGEAGEPGKQVFTLPSANGANKTLKAWVKRAKINKDITWHNLRHSFGTNLIYHDIDLLTTSKLLGHTSTKHTQRYVKASEEMKQKGTDKLNISL